MADAAEQIFQAVRDAPQKGAPLYLQLKRSIEEAVNSGVIGPGDALPSERDIAVKADVSRVTVRKAVQDLVRGGMLVQRHGSGTFVAPRVDRVEQSLSRLTSFTEDMARRGMKVRSEWLDRGLYPPSPDEMMVLGLSPSEQVARVARLRIADDTPLAIERASLSAHVLPDPGGDRRIALQRARKDRQPPGARRAAHFGGQSRRGGGRAAGVPRRARRASTSSASPISPAARSSNSPAPSIGATPMISSSS